MTFNIARAAGPALATATVATLGIPAAFGINAASFGSVAVILLFIRARPQELAARGSARLRDSLSLAPARAAARRPAGGRRRSSELPPTR